MFISHCEKKNIKVTENDEEYESLFETVIIEGTRNCKNEKLLTCLIMSCN